MYVNATIYINIKTVNRFRLPIGECNFMIKVHMRSRFFLLFAGLIVFCVIISPLSALEHDPGDRPTLPETNEFAKKFNKFMEPVSFGVGSEPGLESIAVYLYLIYDYGKDLSWMVRLEMESIIKSDTDLKMTLSSRLTSTSIMIFQFFHS